MDPGNQRVDKFGAAAVRLKLISEAQLKECVQIQQQMLKMGMRAWATRSVMAAQLHPLLRD